LELDITEKKLESLPFQLHGESRENHAILQTTDNPDGIKLQVKTQLYKHLKVETSTELKK
jgi:hypothetical protein